MIYREKRPALYDDTMEFLAGGLFGDLRPDSCHHGEADCTKRSVEPVCIELAIPLEGMEKPYNTMSYHPEEVTEVYLVSQSCRKTKADIVAKAMSVNPDIAIFQVGRDAKDVIVFNKLT